MSRTPYVSRIRHITTGCDYSRIGWHVDAATAEAKHRQHLNARGVTMVRVLECRRATFAEVSEYFCRLVDAGVISAADAADRIAKNARNMAANSQ